MTALRPLLAEPATREQKPVPADLPPALTRQLEKLVKAKITDASFAYGGLSVSAAFIFTLSDGRKIFAKGAHPGDTAHGTKNLAQEVFVYECVGIVRETSPPYIGLVSDGEEDGWMLGVWECVEHDPSRASPGRAITSLASWQRTSAAQALLPVAREHVYISQLLSPEKKWLRLRNDDIAKKKFCHMFGRPEVGKSWFDANIARLAQLQSRVGQLKGEEGILHGDLRIDNFLFGAEKTYVIDWPNACWGPLVFDLVFLFSNMEALGFGSTEGFCTLYSAAAKLPAAEDMAVMLGALSGYFADQAYRDPVEKMPRLRWMQKSMLLAQLRYMARLGLIESPPLMIGENQ